MQTSPAKFFHGANSHHIAQSAKKTINLGKNNLSQPQPEQPAMNFSVFSNSTAALRVSNTSNLSNREAATSIPLYKGGGHSQHQGEQPLKQNQQFTLF